MLAPAHLALSPALARERAGVTVGAQTGGGHRLEPVQCDESQPAQDFAHKL